MFSTGLSQALIKSNWQTFGLEIEGRRDKYFWLIFASCSMCYLFYTRYNHPILSLSPPPPLLSCPQIPPTYTVTRAPFIYKDTKRR
jgi:hypothetical protein